MKTRFIASNSSISVLDQILTRGYLRVGTTGDYKPFTYETNETYIGADIELAASLSTALSLTTPVQFIPTTWSTLATNLTTGSFDIAMGGISITLARAMKFYFSNAVSRAGKVGCIRCTDSAKFTSLATLDVETTTVVVNAGGTNEKFDRANLANANLLVVTDNTIVYEAVANGTADAMISDVVEVELQVRLSNGTLCMLGDAAGPWTFEQLGYMLPRDEVWRSFVNVWLAMEVGNGGLNATMAKWMAYDWTSVAK
ncbi:periplasmic binding protein-like II [Pleomassaria siparia CBS 279.74]|uniref:Periplasmic binding protein-like II n=1 Tax=Pleomassaria siparia CBS 279.74 TaxID=1314801 RepID=A0A6G1K4L7_9PLEO|nr:periplasmic binding protein-like II [Pleomassaria siparia CBS 279.74]